MSLLRSRAHAFLRFTERYARADMTYIAKGGFWVSFGQTAASVLSLLLIIAFANLLPKETYGMYRYILSLAAVLNVFALTGMNSAVARAVAAGQEGAFIASVRYQFKWNVVLFAAFMALAGYYLWAGDLLFSTCFLVLGLFVPPTLAFNTYGAYLEGKREFRLASIYSILSTLVYVVGVFAAIVWSGEVLWLVGAYAGSTLLATAFFYYRTVRRFHPPADEPDRETIAYGRNLTFVGFLEPIAGQVDKIILTHFWGPAQLAVYTLALAIPNRAMSYMKSWVGIAFPKFAQKNMHELDALFYLRIFQGMALGLVAAGAYIVVAPFVFTYALPQYLESIVYSQILSLSLIFAMPNRYISLLLVSQQLTAHLFANSAVQVVLLIALYVAFGIMGGLMGLVLAQVLNNGLSLLINIFVWRHAVRRRT